MSFIDDLIRDYSPATPTLEIELRGDKTLRFKAVTDADTLHAVQTAVAQFKDLIKGPACPEVWKPYLVSNERALGMIATFKETCLNDPPLGYLDFLRIAHDAVWLFEDITARYMLFQTNAEAVAGMKTIDTAKNASSETPSSETA